MIDAHTILAALVPQVFCAVYTRQLGYNFASGVWASIAIFSALRLALLVFLP